jgi:hypothetical protein
VGIIRFMRIPKKSSLVGAGVEDGGISWALDNQ